MIINITQNATIQRRASSAQEFLGFNFELFIGDWKVMKIGVVLLENVFSMRFLLQSVWVGS